MPILHGELYNMAMMGIAETMCQNREFRHEVEQAMGELIHISWSDSLMDENRTAFLNKTYEARVREIGEKLNETGGWPLMSFVCENIRGFQKHPVDSRTLDFAWDRIGDWMA